MSRAERQALHAGAFDQLVERYESAFSERPEQVHAVAWLLERLDAGARVLDVGCGTGVPTARQLADAGMRVVGIDISPGMVATAAAAVPEAVIHNRDIVELDETGFDGAVAFFSLLMLPRAEIVQALSVLHDALEPDGYLVISMVEADLDDTPVKFLDTDVRISGYRRDELLRVVEQAGFAVIDLTTVQYTPSDDQADPEIQLYLFARRQ